MDDRLITGPPVPSFTNRIIILLGAVLVLLAVSSTAWAQPSLSLDSTSGNPGQTVTSTLTVQNNGPAVTLQFEVQFDAAKLSPGNVTAGADLAPQVFNAFSPTAGVLRVVVTPVFGPTLPGIHNGILLNLPFAIAANAAGGATALALANVLLSNATAGSVTPGALTNGTLTIQSLASTALVSAIAPVSRSVQVGTTATAFASILNYGTATALGCGISPISSLPATFSFQALNCATNLPLAALNTPVDIAAGGAGCFIFALTPSSPIAPTNVTFNFDCTNSAPAPITPGVNTFLFSASAIPTLDVIASISTDSNDGILNLPGANGAKFMVAGSINVASVGGTMTVEANTGSVTLPLTVSICLQWDYPTATCLKPSPWGPSATLTVAGGESDSYVILVQGSGTIPFDPAVNRIFLSFHEGLTINGTVRGRTSVAVRTQ